MKKVIIALVIIAVIAAAVIALVANNNNSSDQNGATPPPATNTTTPPPTSNQSTTDKVSISNFAFSPDTITVKKGTTVTWTNNDSVTHTVTADSGDGPKSENLENGETYQFKFDTVGTFNYHCTIHPSMHGTVVVTE